MVQATFGDVWRDSVEMDDGGRAIDLLPTLKPSPPRQQTCVTTPCRVAGPAAHVPGPAPR